MIVLGGGAIGRCLSHEGVALGNGISALIVEAAEKSCPLPPHEDTEKTAVREPGS